MVVVGAPRARGPRWGWATGLALGFLLSSRAEAACEIEIAVEEHPDAAPLSARLREEAERAGACGRRWSMRIEPASSGQYTVTLQSGSGVETRSARNAPEVEAVAGMLLRVAIEQAPPAVPEPPPEPPPLPSSAAEPGASWSVGPTLGAGWKFSTGPASEVGALVRFGGTWGVGVWPVVQGSWGQRASRYDVLVPVVGSVGRRVGEVTVGVGVGAGLESSWVRGVDQGTTVRGHALGLGLGVWPEVRWRSWWVALPVRYSTTSADVRWVTSTTTTKPGKSDASNRNENGNSENNGDNGNGPRPQVTTTSTRLPTVADWMGGWSVVLAVGWLY